MLRERFVSAAMKVENVNENILVRKWTVFTFGCVHFSVADGRCQGHLRSDDRQYYSDNDKTSPGAPPNSHTERARFQFEGVFGKWVS